MSFYLRKSLKAGPFRLNLSKSGIGVSTGVPGFRVGTGPRGNYVHLGRHGVYYRASIPSGKAQRSPGLGDRPWSPLSSAKSNDIIFEDVTGATTAQLAEAAPTEMIDQLNAAAQTSAVAPVVGVIGALASVVLMAGIPVLGVLVAVFAIGATWWMHQRDRARKSVVVFYDVNERPAIHYQQLLDHFGNARTTDQAWHIVAAGAVKTTYQYKTHAGASSILDRVPLTFSTGGPPVLETNIAVPSLETKSRGIYFLPDRLLIRDGKHFADAEYSTTKVLAERTRFIESGPIPRDARQVGTTWKYVNVKGGPDRRYKGNRELPIMEYGETVLEDARGMRVVLQFSRPGSAEDVAIGLEAMASA